ncbi:MAG TPA: FHA domain-containing protein [Pyrinomonadaceae bacterium]|jgi:predicted component of type VI protein secretion system
MRPEVVLTFLDEGGAWREVTVDARRFTIGRGGDNDLVIEAPGVSRRHAVIEIFDGGVLAYDCQSERGTLLNNAPLSSGARLQSGDLLTLGGECDINVRLRDPSAARPRPAPTADATHAPHVHAPAPPRPPAGSNHVRDSAPPPRRAAVSPDAARAGGKPLSLRLPVAAAAVAVAVVLAGVALLLAGRRAAPHATARDARRETATRTPAETPQGSVTGAGGVQPATTDAVADEELERVAARVVQRMSGDDRPYAFPPEALDALRRQLQDYGNSAALAEGFAALQREGRQVAAQARAEGVEPDLVIYAALARGAGRDAAATARQMTPQLRELRATFGSGDADSSLLVLAAYTEGVGSKKSHPLLATIRRLVRNSFAERNVWYLRERGGLSDAAYHFVIRTLAVGVVAQDPQRHGVRAPRPVY